MKNPILNSGLENCKGSSIKWAINGSQLTDVFFNFFSPPIDLKYFKDKGSKPNIKYRFEQKKFTNYSFIEIIETWSKNLSQKLFKIYVENYEILRYFIFIKTYFNFKKYIFIKALIGDKNISS